MQEFQGNPFDIPCIEASTPEKLCKHPVVSIHMTTYNHERYIRRAIDGVMMQKTDFEYELVIGEDASTDRTREVCFEYQKKYPDKIRVLWWHENLRQNPHPAGGNGRRVMFRCRGKYIAFCEGDDYWTDPEKLQKQVEYMEGHPGCGVCFHERMKCDETGAVLPDTGLPDEMKRPLTWEEIAEWKFPCPPTCTVMYRKDALMDRPRWMNKLFFGDRAYSIWVTYAHGTADWVEGVRPGMYRIHGGGVYQGEDLISRIGKHSLFTSQIIRHFPCSLALRRGIYRRWKREWEWSIQRMINGAIPRELEVQQLDILRRLAWHHPCFGVQMFRKRMELRSGRFFRAVQRVGVSLAKEIHLDGIYRWIRRPVQGRNR